MAGCSGKPTALVLGAGTWQVPLIQQLGRLGLRVVAADIASSPPAEPWTDSLIQVDTNDREALAGVVAEVAPHLVLSDQSDRVMPVVGWLNDRFQLPGISERVATRFCNKLAMRRQLVDSAVKMPAFGQVWRADQVAEFAAEHGYPLIVKPLQSWASMGVTRVDGPDRIEAALTAAAGVQGGRDVLVEEYIAGLELTVEGLTLEGKHTVLAISEKAHYPQQPCVAWRLAYPARLSGDLGCRAERASHEVVQRLGLRDGLTHLEFRVRAGEVYLIEAAARGGGHGLSSTLVPHVCGFEPMEWLVRKLLGEQVRGNVGRGNVEQDSGDGSDVVSRWLAALGEQPELVVAGRAAILQFFRFPPGRVREVRIASPDRMRQLANHWELPFQPGDVIGEATDDRRRPGHFVVLGETRDEVDRAAEEVEQLVTVEYEGSWANAG